MKIYYLYRIVNKVNGKLYFGITCQPKVRKYQHFKGKGPSISLVHKAVNKYGKESFDFEVLCAGSQDYILELEAKAVEHFETQQPKGYNIRSGGESSVWPSGHLSHNALPIYAGGFWFPSSTIAIKALGIQKNTFLKRKRDGTIGSEVIVREKSVSDNPQYVCGIWWPNLYIASAVTGLSIRTLRYRLLNGFIEASGRREIEAGKNLKAYRKDNPTPDHALKVIINGKLFNSIAEASKLTGISVSKIRTRLKNNEEGFEYA